MSAAVTVEDVHKRFRLEHDAATSIKGAVLRGLRRGSVEEFWALKGVSLEVPQGSTFGLVGHNGSGKSTLLKCLARILRPDQGRIHIEGRMSALLELGAGFHPELSGRENVFLNAAILGLPAAEVRKRFDDIVGFAGLEHFIDSPVKNYSSGMYVRLGFSVAINIEPDVLLVDEVLAVGDIDFQRRCLERMNRLSEEGRTVVFISHDLGAVARLCTRAIRIERGVVVDEGTAVDVVRDYYADVFRHAAEVEREVVGDAGVRRVALVDAEGRALTQPQRGTPLHVRVEIELRAGVPGLDLAVWIARPDGSRVIDEAWSDQPGLPALPDRPGRHVVELALPPLLPAGDYSIGVWLGSELHTYVFDDLLATTIAPQPDDRAEWATRERVAQPEVAWTVMTPPAPPEDRP